MSKDNDNVTELNQQGKPAKSPKDVINQVRGKLKEAKLKEFEGKVKVILEKQDVNTAKIKELQKQNTLHEEEIEQLVADYSSDLAK